ncbi:MAG: DUF4863 family protein [Myxococcota bacterium]
MSTPEALRAALAPLAERVATLDLADPEAAKAALDREHPVAGLGAVREALLAGRDAGWLVPKQATETLRFGRVAKPAADLGGCSIDAVDMAGAGAPHRHPNGEVSLCFATEGDPRFVGSPEGWVVVGPGSRHVPEVTGGRMLIVYFLPGGAMEWE